MSSNFAYLAHGKLYLKRGDAPVQTIDSRFGESVRQRAIEMQKRHEWKTQGRGAQFMRGSVLWGVDENDPAEMPIAITGVAPASHDGEIAYTLETSDISGIFVIKDGGQTEQRLLHTADFRVGQIAASDEKFTFVVRHKRGGDSNVGIINRDGWEFAEVTQGDTIDLWPRWVTGSKTEIVFQSAGIGRNEAGVWIGQAPFTIQKVDLDRGDVVTLAEDPQADLIAPQMTADGSLYYIRRPYESPHAKMSLWRGLLDLVLLPFRLLFALFQFLNFFTTRYTGKTLTSAGDVSHRQADMRQMMIWGNLRAADASMRNKNAEASPSLVPDSWKLIRKSPDGRTQVLAEGVLSYDLAADGSVIYSNGSAIFVRDGDKPAERLAKDAFIQQVVAVPGS